MSSVKAYIYTIPKAGTYLTSAFLDLIGVESTGWHISQRKFLETKAFDNETNKSEPSRTMVPRPYLASFRKIPSGSHAFGHFNPMYVVPGVLRDFRVIAVKRKLKEVVVSEFIDFRYRRRDVAFVSKDLIPDPIKAFEKYMEKHAPIIKNIAHNFLLLEELSRNEDYRYLVGHNNYLFVDFKSFLDPVTGPGVAFEMSNFLGCILDKEEVEKFRLNALMVENKTKSDDSILDFERASIWSDVATDVYMSLEMDVLDRRLGYV